MILEMMPFEFDSTLSNKEQLQTVIDFETDKTVEDTFINTDIILTESQNELVEKFNAAFFEAQNNQKTNLFSQCSEIIDSYGNILHSSDVDDNFQENIPSPLLESDNSNFLLDLFFSKSEEQDSITEITSESQSSTTDASQNYFNFDVAQNYGFTCEGETKESNVKSVFYIPPPFKPFSSENEVTLDDNSISYENFDDLGLSDLDFCENLSNGSFDIETITTELCESDSYGFDYENTCIETEKKPEKLKTAKAFALPSVTSLGKNFSDRKYLELDNFIRNSPADTINVFAQEQGAEKNACGHLLGNQPNNNNLSVVETYVPAECETNQVVLTQQEAILLHQDPLLSSSSVIFPEQVTRSDLGHSAPESDEEDLLVRGLQCKWEGCWETYPNQKTLVKHIEKTHVELKKGEEFSCFWINCPRKSKPFNARYKLLIHMRVHSGEKPNKCPFNGCNKAFSRLENLKIHQRSHTGERPYLCQFASCTKSFSNSSDRAKHQRTHFDTKPYACQISGCAKRYTDPSSLRKHVKNHTASEQAQLKKKQQQNREMGREIYRQNSTDSFQDPAEPKQFRKFTINSLANNSNVGHFRKISFSSDDQCSTVDSSFFEITINNAEHEEHSYSTCAQVYENFVKEHVHRNVKLDLKNKISEKNRQKRLNSQLARAESF